MAKLKGVPKFRFKGVKGAVIFCVLIGLVLTYYFYLNNYMKPKTEPEEESISAVQDVLFKDLDKNYPPTPKTVVEYYSDLTMCFYNEELTENDLKALAEKAEGLYDEELLENNRGEQYMIDLKSDIDSFKKEELKISSYVVSNSMDVEEFTQDGRECARLYCVYNLRQGTSMLATREVFILRKDEKGHYKILGWDIAEDGKGSQDGE